MKWSPLLWLCLGQLASSCARDEHRILEDHCELLSEASLAPLQGTELDGIDNVDGIIFWSDASGLWAARTGPGTHPDPDGWERTRLAPRCDGGLDALWHDNHTYIACLRRAQVERDNAGAAVLYRWNGHMVQVVRSVEGVGAESEGVAVAFDHNEAVLAYQDASNGSASIRLSRAVGDPLSITPERVRGSSPTLLATPEGVAFAWVESWTDREGRAEGRLMVQVGEARPRQLEELHNEAVTPTLLYEGALAVVFRDQRPARTRPKVFLRRVDQEEAREGVFANGAGASSATSCMGRVVVVSPRRHSRVERLVAIRVHNNRSLEGEGPEHEIYQSGAAFESAAAACLGDRLQIAFASRPTIERPNGSVRVTGFRCEGRPISSEQAQ